jgi:DNA-binding SARP family transcriptional activator
MLRLGGPCEQRLLAALLLEANRVVSLARLAEVIWGDDPPATATKQVRNGVSRLRRTLADGGAPGLIVTDGGGYRLAVAGNVLDARLFEARVALARHAASGGQVAAAARLLRYALDLWRGPALAGMTGWVIEAAATAWDERRYAVAGTFYDHQLDLGRHREVVAELQAFAAEHPLREEPAGQLMLALYRCGRRADALAVYGRTRALLAAELGLDPGSALQRLHQQILTADPSLASGPPRTGT